MALNILALSQKKADELLDLDKESIQTDYSTYKLLYKGDHWRGGNGWVGPKPEGDNSAQILLRIQRQFASKNVVREVITRHTNSVFGKSPTVEILPAIEVEEGGDKNTPEEMKEIQSLKKAVSKWMKDKNVISKLQKALAMTLYGEVAILRFYIPKSNVDENGRLVDTESVEEAIEKIWFDISDIEGATVYQESDTKRRVGIFNYENDDEDEFVEITFKVTDFDVNGEQTEEGDLDFPYLSADNIDKTFIATFGGEEIDISEPIQLHGNLTMYRVQREAIITEQVKQNQDLLNKALTMWSANLDWSAFVERIILNGMPPGQWKENADNEWEFDASGELKTGPSTTSFISGIPKFNEGGEIVGAESPSVVFRDPINPDTFEKTRKTFYQNILEETHQAHIMLQAESQPSGISRREAKKDFEDDVSTSVNHFNEAGKWMIETLIYLATWMNGTDADEPEYIAQFECNPNLGAVTSEDVDIIAKMRETGLISDETAMSRLGVDDVKSEKAKIDTDFLKAKALLDVITQSQYTSAELVVQLYKKMIGDLDILAELQDSEVNTILEEIRTSVNSSAQENDFLGQIGSTGTPTEETE